MNAYLIAANTEIPCAEAIDRATGDKWWSVVFRCSICGTRTWRRDRLSLAGAHICTACGIGHNLAMQEAATAYRDAENEKRWERNCKISDMQGYGDTSSPDSLDSPGARWLLSLHNAVTEAWESGRFGEDSMEDRDGVLDELADGAVSPYTHDRWLVWTDLCLYNNDECDRFANGGEPTELAGAVMEDVARTAMSGWLDNQIAELTCAECGEYPCECEDESDDTDDTDN